MDIIKSLENEKILDKNRTDNKSSGLTTEGMHSFELINGLLSDVLVENYRNWKEFSDSSDAIIS